MNEQIEILILEMKEYLEDIAKGKEGWQIPVIDKIQLKSFIEEVNQTLKYYK